MKLKIECQVACGFGPHKNPSEVFLLTDTESCLFPFCMSMLWFSLTHYTQDSTVTVCPWTWGCLGRQNYFPNPWVAHILFLQPKLWNDPQTSQGIRIRFLMDSQLAHYKEHPLLPQMELSEATKRSLKPHESWVLSPAGNLGAQTEQNKKGDQWMGPWTISTRRTQKLHLNSKRYKGSWSVADVPLTAEQGW